ncbi:hypothetical protein PR048_000216 [Dryococelus australis]|uniref:Uncharacterized protein n=1 Tax=Dryococelus australis TaxID=614101 RepID=A0ABQ9IF72_9NEOP|nr:hypothetical protein PR048_000216 [Dryococelus australis]
MEQRRNEMAGETGDTEITRQTVACTIPACENPGATQPGIELSYAGDRACSARGRCSAAMPQLKHSCSDYSCVVAASPYKTARRRVWVALSSEVLGTDDGEVSGAGMTGPGKPEIPEKTHRPTAPSGTIPTCENPVTRQGLEPSSPWWECVRPAGVRCTSDCSPSVLSSILCRRCSQMTGVVGVGKFYRWWKATRQAALGGDEEKGE